MRIINLTPVETIIAKPPEERTAIEQAIVIAYQQGEAKAEEAASEYAQLKGETA